MSVTENRCVEGILGSILNLGVKLGALSGTVLGFLYIPVSIVIFWAGKFVAAGFSVSGLFEDHSGTDPQYFKFFGFLLLIGAISGVVGLLLGIINGLLSGALTLIFFRPLDDVRCYRRTAAAACTSISFLCIFALLDELFDRFLVSPQPARQGLLDLAAWSWLTLLPALVAAGAGCWASLRVARWYQEEVEYAAKPHVFPVYFS